MPKRICPGTCKSTLKKFRDLGNKFLRPFKKVARRERISKFEIYMRHSRAIITFSEPTDCDV